MKRAFQYVTHYGSANQEFADASVRRYEQKGVLRAGVPSPLPKPPALFPFLPIPYPLPLSTPATQANFHHLGPLSHFDHFGGLGRFCSFQ